MPKSKLVCPICGCKFERYLSKSSVSNPKCSKKCTSLYFQQTMKGENNPNYGNRWSEERKRQHSKIVKEKLTDEIRYKIGSANRGKKFSKKLIKKMHENRTKESYSHPHSEELKKIIGEKSKEKWTKPGYKEKHRKMMEELGHWLPIKDKSDFDIYFSLSNWKAKMFDKIVSKKELNLLKKHGVFHCRNNTCGVVRDHILSRRTGFNKGIFPEIMRHPANCRIITHKQNVSKRIKNIDRDDITIEKLFNKILKYKKEWKEQDRCIKLIKKYKQGKRFNRKDYI